MSLSRRAGQPFAALPLRCGPTCFACLCASAAKRLGCSSLFAPAGRRSLSLAFALLCPGARRPSESHPRRCAGAGWARRAPSTRKRAAWDVAGAVDAKAPGKPLGPGIPWNCCGRGALFEAAWGPRRSSCGPLGPGETQWGHWRRRLRLCGVATRSGFGLPFHSFAGLVVK